jgi:hypothetical protein
MTLRGGAEKDLETEMISLDPEAGSINLINITEVVGTDTSTKSIEGLQEPLKEIQGHPARTR